MKVIVTGASGFIGAFLVRYLAEAGFKVVAMQRSQPRELPAGVEFQQHDLSTDFDDAKFVGAAYLVHTAFAQFSQVNRGSNQTNREGTQQLIDACKTHDVNIIYFSSMSAHASAESNYGRSKFEIEKMFEQTRDVVLKPGLVLGEGGLFFRILSVVQKSRFIPVVAGEKPIQTIALAELAELLVIIMRNFVPGYYAIGESNPISMKKLYKTIAATLYTNPVLIPVPLRLVHCLAYCAELVGINLPVTTENVLGLKKMRSFNTKHSSAVFGYKFSSFDKTLSGFDIRHGRS
jgi:nucleoside-diphosphate-sugar epimerase